MFLAANFFEKENRKGKLIFHGRKFGKKVKWNEKRGGEEGKGSLP